jgi:hypothetical protein
MLSLRPARSPLLLEAPPEAGWRRRVLLSLYATMRGAALLFILYSNTVALTKSASRNVFLKNFENFKGLF